MNRKINNRYGKIFKELREKRSLPLSHFEKIGISKSSLAKFERGETMMKFDRVVNALQEMDFTLTEFEHFINDFSLSYIEEKLKEIEVADFTQDSTKLEEIYQDTKIRGYTLTSLSAKALFMGLTEEEEELIINHLFETESWGYFELSIFYFTMDCLKTREILKLLHPFLLHGHTFLDIQGYREKFLQVSYRAVARMCYTKNQELAHIILGNTRLEKYEHSLLLTNIRNIIEGYYIYTFENQSKGEELMNEAIWIFNKLNSHKIAEYYQHRYDKYIK